MKCRENDYFKGILQKGFLEHVFRPLSCSPYFSALSQRILLAVCPTAFIFFMPLSSVDLKPHKLGVGGTLDSSNYPTYLAPG